MILLLTELIIIANYDLVVAALSEAKRGTENIILNQNYLYCNTTNFDYVKVSSHLSFYHGLQRSSTEITFC